MSRFVVINRQKVYLTIPQQQAWDKMLNDVRHAARREGRCGQPDYHKCRGDCGLCPYQKQGSVLSIDAVCSDAWYDFGAYQLADHSSSFEDAILSELMLAELYRVAGLRERDGDQILRLFLESGLSSYKIAAQLGLRQTTVNDRLNRLLAYIRANREELLGL